MSITVLDTPRKIHTSRKRIVRIFLLFFALLIFIVGILLMPLLFQELRREESISSFTVSGNSLYFGGGYHLYRLDLSTRSLEPLFRTDRILVEQPIIAEGVAYFGGPSWQNRWGFSGDDDAFFALDLHSGRIVWRFEFDHQSREGGRTVGTYPTIAGDRILVCASQHLDCLDRRNGQLLWHIDGWFGGITRPYIFRDFVCYKINEEYFTGSSQNDGHWAVVELASGNRRRIIPTVEKPGTYEDMEGNGSCVLVDGVLYGATRYYHFGAMDLQAERLLWEFDGTEDELWQFSQHTPAVNDRLVYTAAGDSIYALDRKTGQVVWKAWAGEVCPVKNFEGYEYRTGAYRVRFAATNDVVIARGFSGVGAWRADTGQLLWSVKSEAGYDDADPLIFEETAIISCAKECRVFALDLRTGHELWSVSVPDCTYYKLVDKS
jgi:outer membrane protein assembly factor BamB